MNSILEALAENRLNVFDNQFPQTEKYRTLKAKMNSCIERYLKKFGEQKRPVLDQFLALIFEQNRLLGKDSFLHGFRLGALATIESYMNQGKFIVPAQKQQDGTAEQSPSEQFYQDLILHYFSDNIVNTRCPTRLHDKRSLELSEKYEPYFDAAFPITESNNREAFNLGDELVDIIEDMQIIEGHNRFTCGYSLGLLMMAEIFQGRDELTSHF